MKTIWYLFLYLILALNIFIYNRIDNLLKSLTPIIKKVYKLFKSDIIFIMDKILHERL